MSGSTRNDTSRQCYLRLRRLIMYGQLAAGERLGEVEWSQNLGVHRAALREAMALLAHEGLLRRGARGGFFVPQFERSDIAEIVEARLVIELGALRMICRREPNLEDLAPLQTLCDNMRRLIESDLFLGYVEADRKFHEVLVELAGNSRLTTMYANAPIPHLLPCTPVLEIQPETFASSIAEHQKLVDLLAGQEYQEAHDLLENHIGRLLLQPV